MNHTYKGSIFLVATVVVVAALLCGVVERTSCAEGIGALETLRRQGADRPRISSYLIVGTETTEMPFTPRGSGDRGKFAVDEAGAAHSGDHRVHECSVAIAASGHSLKGTTIEAANGSSIEVFLGPEQIASIKTNSDGYRTALIDTVRPSSLSREPSVFGEYAFLLPSASEAGPGPFLPSHFENWSQLWHTALETLQSVEESGDKQLIEASFSRPWGLIKVTFKRVGAHGDAIVPIQTRFMDKEGQAILAFVVEEFEWVEEIGISLAKKMRIERYLPASMPDGTSRRMPFASGLFQVQKFTLNEALAVDDLLFDPASVNSIVDVQNPTVEIEVPN